MKLQLDLGRVRFLGKKKRQDDSFLERDEHRLGECRSPTQREAELLATSRIGGVVVDIANAYKNVPVSKKMLKGNVL